MLATVHWQASHRFVQPQAVYSDSHWFLSQRPGKATRHSYKCLVLTESENQAKQQNQDNFGIRQFRKKFLPWKVKGPNFGYVYSGRAVSPVYWIVRMTDPYCRACMVSND